jgi:DNA primase
VKIPPNIIDDVRSQTDIVDVVGDYVRLKKRGSNFVGLCPFHTEKTPSFNVNPARDIYKCFGCGVGGDVFNFVSETEGLSFPESVRLLADRAGITIPDESGPDEDASETDGIYHALRFAARTFFNSLTQTEGGAPAREYLLQRGMTADSVKTFGVGYAPDAWDSLTREAEETKIEIEFLEKAGLAIPRKGGDGHYDRYRKRVIFPITSHVGKIIGFGGRVLDPEDEPKYINSPETLVYSKSKVLYGLFQARNPIRKREEALLVEGYTDVIALHQAGVDNAVATCGTALTVEQVHLLSRYANRIVLLYDSDSAGVRAAFRAIDLILEHGIGASAVALPKGHDPDSFVRENGPEAFELYLKEKRQDIVHFILENARAAGQMETPEGQATVQRTVLSSISKIPDPLVRESYIKLASDAMDIPDLQLRGVLDSITRSAGKKRQTVKSRASNQHLPSTPTASDRHAGAGNHFVTHPESYGEDHPGGQPAIEQPSKIFPSEKNLFAIMLQDGLPLVEFVMSNLALTDFSAGTSRRLAESVIAMYEEGKMNLTGLIEGTYGADIRRLATEVLTRDVEPSENWERLKKIPVPGHNQEARESATSAMTLLKLERIDQAIRDLQKALYDVQGNAEETRVLAEKMMELHAMKKVIQERKFIRGVK